MDSIENLLGMYFHAIAWKYRLNGSTFHVTLDFQLVPSALQSLSSETFLISGAPCILLDSKIPIKPYNSPITGDFGKIGGARNITRTKTVDKEAGQPPLPAGCVGLLKNCLSLCLKLRLNELFGIVLIGYYWKNRKQNKL
jgi:hypothetical protein